MNPYILHQKKEMASHAPAINYRLKSEVSLTLCCQLCSTHYIQHYESKSTSTIKVTTMKNTDDFHYKEKPSCATAKSKPFVVSTGKSMKNELCVLRYMPKGTCLAEVMSSSENIKPIVLNSNPQCKLYKESKGTDAL